MSQPATYGPLVESRCPQCDYKLTGATIVHGVDQKPEEGDANICLNCGQVLVYAADLTLRPATRSEVRELMEQGEPWAVIEKAQMLIRRRGRFA
jgi:hypothetical protein